MQESWLMSVVYQKKAVSVVERDIENENRRKGERMKIRLTLTNERDVNDEEFEALTEWIEDGDLTAIEELFSDGFPEIKMEKI